MEPRIYNGKKAYTCADGTIKYYDTHYKYIPKNPPGEKQVRAKKEGSVGSVAAELKQLNPAELELTRAYVRQLINRRVDGGD